MGNEQTGIQSIRIFTIRVNHPDSWCGGGIFFLGSVMEVRLMEMDVQNGFCQCLEKGLDSTTERGQLFFIIDHYPECVEYRAALQVAVKMAKDYPRLQHDFDQAMSMLAIANREIDRVRMALHHTGFEMGNVLDQISDKAGSMTEVSTANVQ